MKKNVVIFIIASAFAIGFASCSGCVKKASKAVTEVGISAIEGVAEAVDEHGEKIAEKTTDAAGKLVVGMGRSIDRQLDEHAKTVAATAGKVTVQSVDGFVDGFNAEIDSLYHKLPYSEDFVSGVSLNYFGKYKKTPVVDSYFIIPEKGIYKAKYECFDKNDKLFLTKNIDIDRTSKKEDRRYTLVSFALNSNEETAFSNLKNVKITVTKQQ